MSLKSRLSLRCSALQLEALRNLAAYMRPIDHGINVMSWRSADSMQCNDIFCKSRRVYGARRPSRPSSLSGLCNLMTMPIGRRYRSALRIFVSQIFLDRAWTSNDLCSQCQSPGLGASRFEARTVRHRLRIIKGTNCPLCHYFLLVLFDEGAGSLPDAVNIVVDIAPEPSNRSQRRITFADEARLNSPTRYTLQLTNQSSASRTTVSYRLVDENEVDFALLQTWIGRCREEHLVSCSFRNIMGSQSHPDNPGFKFIDCHTRQIVPAKMEACSYVALSYVWGNPSSDEPEIEVRPGYLPPKLPNTIEDAMKATIGLGFQYLWIDKYCINQNDVEDKRAQVMMMDVIYQAATITIIAAAGSSSYSGLPGMSFPRDLPPTLQLDGTTWVATRADYKHAVKQSTWFTRGWT